MNKADVQKIIDRIQFRDWNFVLEEREDCFDIQIQFMAPCNVAHGEPELQHCRKWMVSRHCCENEVVRTAYKAIQGALEHEAAEQFLFDGIRIFDPHVNYTELAKHVAVIPLDMRT